MRKYLRTRLSSSPEEERRKFSKKFFSQVVVTESDVPAFFSKEQLDSLPWALNIYLSVDHSNPRCIYDDYSKSTCITLLDSVYLKAKYSSLHKIRFLHFITANISNVLMLILDNKKTACPSPALLPVNPLFIFLSIMVHVEALWIDVSLSEPDNGSFPLSLCS